MKKYHVYGIGNALVDMEFEMTPEILKKLDVEKGVMTLVDEKRRDELISKLDLSQAKKSCGGSAANTVIGVAQFGGKSFYSCKVAGDDTGEFFHSDLLEKGVKTNLSKNKMSGKSGKCLVFITPDADRTMNTYLGISETLSHHELSEPDLINSEYFYIEGYLVTSPSAREAVLKGKKIAENNGVKTSLSFSDPNMVKYFREGLLEMVGNGVDLLFCNEEEALTFSQSRDIYDAVNKLKKIAKTFAITMGSRGALVFDGRNELTINPHKVKAIDTNGAGDLFAGAFLSQITQGKNYKIAGDFASLSSAKLVTQFGPRLSQTMLNELLLSAKELKLL